MIDMIGPSAFFQLTGTIVAFALLPIILSLYISMTVISWCCYICRSSIAPISAALYVSHWILTIAPLFIQLILLSVAPIIGVSMTQTTFPFCQVAMMIMFLTCFGSVSFSVYFTLTNFAFRSEAALPFFSRVKVFQCCRKFSITSRALLYSINNRAFSDALCMLFAIGNKPIGLVLISKKVFSSGRKKLLALRALLVSIGRQCFLYRTLCPISSVVAIDAIFAKVVKPVLIPSIAGKEIGGGKFVLQTLCALLLRGVFGYDVFHDRNLLSVIAPRVVDATPGQKHVQFISSFYHKSALQASLYLFSFRKGQV